MMFKDSMRQRGSMVVELLLALVVVGAIGASIYYSSSKSKPVTKEAAKPKGVTTEINPAQANSAKVYEGWKTYTSANEGLTFRYPANWQITAGEDGQGADGATLVSPSGFTITYAAAASGLGGACMPEECPDVQTYKVEKISGTNAPSDLYYVEGSYKSNAAEQFMGMYKPMMGVLGKIEGRTVPRVGEQLQTLPYYFVSQKRNNATNGLVMFYLDANPSQSISDPRWWFNSKEKVKAFFDTPDAKTAKLIFESVKY